MVRALIHESKNVPIPSDGFCCRYIQEDNCVSVLTLRLGSACQKRMVLGSGAFPLSPPHVIGKAPILPRRISSPLDPDGPAELHQQHHLVANTVQSIFQARRDRHRPGHRCVQPDLNRVAQTP